MENGLKNDLLNFQKVSLGRFFTLVAALSELQPIKLQFLGTMRYKNRHFPDLTRLNIDTNVKILPRDTF